MSQRSTREQSGSHRRVSESVASQSVHLEKTYGQLRGLMVEWVSRRSNVDVKSVDPGAPLASQGLDSVSIVELVCYVEEQAGISVPDTAVYDDQTIAGLAACLAANELAGHAPAKERPAAVASNPASSDSGNQSAGVAFPDSPFR